MACLRHIYQANIRNISYTHLSYRSGKSQVHIRAWWDFIILAAMLDFAGGAGSEGVSPVSLSYYFEHMLDILFVFYNVG